VILFPLAFLWIAAVLVWLLRKSTIDPEAPPGKPPPRRRRPPGPRSSPREGGGRRGRKRRSARRTRPAPKNP
jgi:hypothetical protein